MKHIFLHLLLCINFKFFEINAADPLAQTLLETQNLKEFNGFLDHVLKQINASDFEKIIIQYKSQSTTKPKQNLYEFIRNESHYYKKWPFIWTQIKAMQRQKHILAGQTAQLLNQKSIKNIVEIGTPGTYLSALNKKISIIGHRYAIYDGDSWKNRFFNFAWRPLAVFKSYDTDIHLDNYAPISTNKISAESIDVIVSYIGLHHIPSEKLQKFIGSISRILRPGGTLILREHDVTSPHLNNLVSSAHSVFSAIAMDITSADEEAEIRNFKPSSEWKALLKGAGLIHETYNGQTGILQDGDPTKNALIKFIKTQNKEKPGPPQELAKRSLINTFLTTPEWYNVDISQQYAKFI